MIQKSSIWKVLQVFFRQPNSRKYVREISREIGLATTSVKKHVEDLKKEKLILEKNDDLYPYYIANKENKEFIKYKQINNKFEIEESGLIEFIENEISPNSIIVFGSVAKGEDYENSDLDIFIEAKEQKINFKKFEKKLNRKIDEFFAEDINKIQPQLRNNIINGVKLRGYLKVF